MEQKGKKKEWGDFLILSLLCPHNMEVLDTQYPALFFTAAL